MQPVSRSRRLIVIVVTATVTALAGACGGAVQLQPDEVIELGPTRGERYAVALRQTLDVYEAEVTNAYMQSYPTFEVAYATSRRFTDPELTAILESRLERQGLTLAGLNEYAAEHPEWVSAQNRIFRERIAEVRGTAFAIMARFEREGSAGDAFPVAAPGAAPPAAELAEAKR
jgi:hypothetical protein